MDKSTLDSLFNNIAMELMDVLDGAENFTVTLTQTANYNSSDEGRVEVDWAITLDNETHNGHVEFPL